MYYRSNDWSGGGMRLATVAVPKKVRIAGKWWKLRPFTAQERKDASKKGVGACWYGPKMITYHPRQHREGLLTPFYMMKVTMPSSRNSPFCNPWLPDPRREGHSDAGRYHIVHEAGGVFGTAIGDFGPSECSQDVPNYPQDAPGWPQIGHGCLGWSRVR